jgi:small subunit ribosomal protein S1
MAGPGKPPSLQPRRPDPRNPGGSVTPPRRPPQVVMLKKDEPKDLSAQPQTEDFHPVSAVDAPAPPASPRPPAPGSEQGLSEEDRFSLAELEGMTMADLLGPSATSSRRGGLVQESKPIARAELRQERLQKFWKRITNRIYLKKNKNL